VHVINYFTWQERGVSVYVVAIITTITGIRIAVDFQLWLCHALYWLFL